MSAKRKATIEIFINGRWRLAAEFEPYAKSLGLGYQGGGILEYEFEYAFSALSENELLPNIAFNYPVTFGGFDTPRWPAFLLDIIPTGAGRRVWLKRMGRRGDGPEADWSLLLQGAGNPPGNLRIAEAAMAPAPPHDGFTREEIIDKNADFIEYAEERGAVMAGATDVQGDAPKYLLERDHRGRWHPSGSLPDAEVADCWLVKFPRGKKEKDRTVLRNEAPYLEVARMFGLKVGRSLEFCDDSLFIPRFDREAHSGILERHGLETVCSAAEVAEFGKQGNHLVFCEAIADSCTDYKDDVLEYVRRDILNCALRNTDNHGRNTAILKRRGTASLSPVYDFAPMFLDPEGIPRASRWPVELEPAIGRPDWAAIEEALSDMCDTFALREAFAQDAETVRRLPELMEGCGVEGEVIEGVARRCEEIAEDLAKAARR
ncbi:HipA domain-containing protein [Geomonas sp. Red69]|uniref:type II toxin-antitoxin system HipA family toxin n=1 Tax=Geomonas diazotrophica TaxID=2843197 RepID=UPI001C1220F3|nr:HipA domain-containing protein [Geomonas diazotrophica]MBU5637986.1 HipA domain-containing protein [Geomonas diazotrophica]